MTINLGWKTLTKKKTVTLVGEAKGGGMRLLQTPENATVDDIIALAKTVFRITGNFQLLVGKSM